MMTKSDQLSPELQAKIKALHKQMTKDEAAGGVTPNPTIVNRRTGDVAHFGRRRAFDGAYVGEVLAASGCRNKDIERLIPLLGKVIGHDEEATVEELLDNECLEGCGVLTHEEAEQVKWCFQPLVDNDCGDWMVAELVERLPFVFSEQVPHHYFDALGEAGPNASLTVRDGRGVIRNDSNVVKLLNP
jgi:hypothetical protein